MERLKIDVLKVRSFLIGFIREHTATQGFTKVVIGLSGGLDSSVSAYLAAEALGGEHCIGAFLPHRLSHSDSLKDAQLVAGNLGINTRLVDITPFVQPFEAAFSTMNKIQAGNVMTRCRMIALYQISAEENALVMGTSNKSEILLGYGTLHGDLACAFNPLGDLYKTQVRALSEELGVPEKIRQKTPSADLWTGQSDEGELGLTYDEADQFFSLWIDEKYSRDQLVSEGFSSEFTDRVMKLVKSQRYKSVLPTIPKIPR